MNNRHAFSANGMGYASVLAIALCVFSGNLLAQTLHPISLNTNSGSSSKQPLTALERYDQTGAQDIWDGYIEFSSSKRAVSTIFEFTSPAGAAIESLAVDVNYKGPAKSEQTWLFQLYDYQDKTWVRIGDNADAANWLWSQMSYLVPSEPMRFVNESGRIKLRYQSRNPKVGDASDLDYLAIRLIGGDGGSGDDGVSDGDDSNPNKGLTPGTSWQMQLSDAINTSYDAQVYDIDLFDAPQSVIDALHANGRRVICYFSAGSWENWRPDSDRFPARVKGASNGWPGEKWLNIADMETLGPIMRDRLDMAVSRGCDGVDPDNVDGYANKTGFALTAADQLRFNRFLADEAHARGLLIGLKNDVDQIAELVDDFDFAVNEQCQEYGECEMLDPFIAQNKLVMQIEYALLPSKFCPAANGANRDAQKKTLNLDSKVVMDCRKDY